MLVVNFVHYYHSLFYNPSRRIKAKLKTSLQSFQEDNTYETQSRISFVASRFENGEFITCESNNQVIVDHQEEPHRASITLQVLCKDVMIECGRHNLPKGNSPTVSITN